MKKTTLLLRDAIVVFAILFTFSAYSQTTQTVDLIATQDTYIKGKSGDDRTKSNGDCDDLIVGNKTTDLQRALLQFDVSSIPSDAYIESAELRLDSNTDKDMTIGVCWKLLKAWDEGNDCGAKNKESNWLERTSSDSWSSPGVVGNNYNDGTPLYTINANYKGIHSWFITVFSSGMGFWSLINNGVMLGCKMELMRKQKYESREKGDDDLPTLGLLIEQYTIVIMMVFTIKLILMMIMMVFWIPTNVPVLQIPHYLIPILRQ